MIKFGPLGDYGIGTSKEDIRLSILARYGDSLGDSERSKFETFQGMVEYLNDMNKVPYTTYGFHYKTKLFGFWIDQVSIQEAIDNGRLEVYVDSLDDLSKTPPTYFRLDPVEEFGTLVYEGSDLWKEIDERYVISQIETDNKYQGECK